MNLGLEGKYALITGGSHGIGLAIAKVLLAEGCHVAICSRYPEQAKLPKKVWQLKCNVLDDEQIWDTMDNLYQSWDTLHILVNNVGGGGRWGTVLPHMAGASVWKDVHQKNTIAAVEFTMSVLPLMVKQQWGRIVTVTSIYGREAGGRPWFTMAKSAEIALMKEMASIKAYARANITFNSVAPGPILIPDTGWDIMSREEKEKYEAYIESLPLGRLGTPNEVAAVVAFLCSGQASLINGACVAIDGGQGRAF